MPTFANINVGASPNDGTGDSLRESFRITNNNMSLLSTIITDSGNITANITSTGTSTFNIANITTLNGVTIAGTLTTASQPNITSVGTLSTLTVSGTTEQQGTFNANGPVNAYNGFLVASTATFQGQYKGNIVEISGSYNVNDSDYILLANTAGDTNAIVTLPNADVSSNRILQIRYYDPTGLNANTTTVTVNVAVGSGNIFTSGSLNFNSFDMTNITFDTAELISNGIYWLKLTKS